MTSETQDRRGLVAESYRYARAFYDDAEATGPAAFERNRQAIIDVIALAYRDGTVAAQQPDDALRVAALEVMKSYEAYVSLGAEPGPDTTGAPPKPEDDWDEYDYMMIPRWRALKAALAGAPWEPSDQMVRRAELAVRLEFAKVQVDAINVARAALKAAMGSDTST